MYKTMIEDDDEQKQLVAIFFSKKSIWFYNGYPKKNCGD